MPKATANKGYGFGAFKAPNIQPVEMPQATIKYMIVVMLIDFNGLCPELLQVQEKAPVKQNALTEQLP